MPDDNESSCTQQRLPYKLPPPDPRFDATHQGGSSMGFILILFSLVVGTIMVVELIATMR